MILYKIPEVKAFMARLLMGTAFDALLLKEMELATFTTFTVSGQFNEEFFSRDELEQRNGIKAVFWSEVRPIAYNMIKGNKTPLSFKLVFQLPPQQCQNLLDRIGGKMKLEELGGLYLNIRFEKGELSIITGTAIKTFSLDKSLEHEWDAYAGRMLKELGIAYEQIS